MTDLTELGIKALRDGIASGDFTAREAAEAFNVAVEKASALNAFIVTTVPDFRDDLAAVDVRGVVVVVVRDVGVLAVVNHVGRVVVVVVDHRDGRVVQEILQVLVYQVLQGFCVEFVPPPPIWVSCAPRQRAADEDECQ